MIRFRGDFVSATMDATLEHLHERVSRASVDRRLEQGVRPLFMTIRDTAPVRSGRYRRSFELIVRGGRTSANAWIINRAPYANKIAHMRRRFEDLQARVLDDVIEGLTSEVLDG